MYRGNRLVIRLNKEERAAVERLAETMRLPASTYARIQLLQKADSLGLCENKEISATTGLATRSADSVV